MLQHKRLENQRVVALPYCHIDLADSVVDSRGVETGSPIIALFAHFLLGL